MTPSGTDASDPTFTDRLRAESDWEAATRHRFVREVHADRIDDAVFRRYLVQDYAFVGTLGSVVGYAAGQAPTLESQGRLAEFLVTLSGAEDDYFRRAFDALAVPETDRTDPDLAPVTTQLRDLLLGAAREGGYAETLAVLLPVEWVYLDWATAGDADDPVSRDYLREWVEIHATDEFAAFVAWLRSELDARGPALSPDRRERVERFFRRAVELEAAFFDAAYADDPAR